jgi:hypothetical protein
MQLLMHMHGPPLIRRCKCTRITLGPDLLAVGTYTITTTVSSTTPDPDTANNTVTATCNVLTGVLISCTGG